MKNKTIFSSGIYQIIEIADEHYTIDEILGDSYCPEANPDLDVEALALEKERAIARIELLGTYGYNLQKWNPEVGFGWENIDSCWGFIGSFESNKLEFNHYIVSEFQETINKLTRAA